MKTWLHQDDLIFEVPGKVSKGPHPGYWEIITTIDSTFKFREIKLRPEEVISFPDSGINLTLKEIDKFLSLKHKYQEFGLTYKRGVLLFGPPGTGKSSTIRALISRFKQRELYSIKLTNVYEFKDCLSYFRTVFPDKVTLIVIEDLDNLVEDHEEELLEILDGTSDLYSNLVFIASTNYPQRMNDRILSRPGRFDTRLLIGLPSKEVRKLYLKNLFRKGSEVPKESLEKWVEVTQGLSLSHIKEIFISVMIYSSELDSALEKIEVMKDSIDPETYLTGKELKDYLEISQIEEDDG